MSLDWILCLLAVLAPSVVKAQFYHNPLGGLYGGGGGLYGGGGGLYGHNPFDPFYPFGHPGVGYGVGYPGFGHNPYDPDPFGRVPPYEMVRQYRSLFNAGSPVHQLDALPALDTPHMWLVMLHDGKDTNVRASKTTLEGLASKVHAQSMSRYQVGAVDCRVYSRTCREARLMHTADSISWDEFPVFVFVAKGDYFYLQTKTPQLTAQTL